MNCKMVKCQNFPRYAKISKISIHSCQKGVLHWIHLTQFTRILTSSCLNTFMSHVYMSRLFLIFSSKFLSRFWGEMSSKLAFHFEFTFISLSFIGWTELTPRRRDFPRRYSDLWRPFLRTSKSRHPRACAKRPDASDVTGSGRRRRRGLVLLQRRNMTWGRARRRERVRQPDRN